MKPVRVISSSNISYFETRCETLSKEGYQVSSTSHTSGTYTAILVLQETKTSTESVTPPKKAVPSYMEKINGKKINLLCDILNETQFTVPDMEKAEAEIINFDLETIIIGGDAFYKAINRYPEKNNANYFFGTLASIQKNRAYKHFYTPYKNSYTG